MGLQGLRHRVDVLGLIDRDPVVGVVQHLVVHVGVDVTLGAEHLLEARVPQRGQ